MVGRIEGELCADTLELDQRRLFEGRARRVEDRAGVHHRAIQEQLEQLVAEVVVRGDLPARASDRVAAQPPHPALHRDQHGRERAAQIVERVDVQRGDARQPHQVLALPQTVHIRLAQSDAPAQQRPVEAWRAHLERDPQRARPCSLAERVALCALDDLKLTAVQPAQGSQHDRSGEPAHASAPFSGCGK
jgi:hypothetical protein